MLPALRLKKELIVKPTFIASVDVDNIMTRAISIIYVWNGREKKTNYHDLFT
jgi:hypothetical protein